MRFAWFGRLGVSVPLGERTQWVLPSRVTETAVWSGVVDYIVILQDLTTLTMVVLEREV